MRMFLLTILALFIGFVMGMMISEVIGIAGFVGFGRVIGIKYLPVYTAIAFAVIANLVDARLRHKSGKA